MAFCLSSKIGVLHQNPQIRINIVISAINLPGSCGAGGTGDAEIGLQMINTLWFPVFLCQFPQACARLTLSNGPDQPPNDLDCHIKGTEKSQDQICLVFKRRGLIPLALCSYYHLCDMDLADFSSL